MGDLLYPRLTTKLLWLSCNRMAYPWNNFLHRRFFYNGIFSCTYASSFHIFSFFFFFLFETPKILIIRCFSESSWLFQHRTRRNFKPAIAARRRHFRLELQHFSTSDAFHLLFFFTLPCLMLHKRRWHWLAIIDIGLGLWRGRLGAKVTRVAKRYKHCAKQKKKRNEAEGKQRRQSFCGASLSYRYYTTLRREGWTEGG